RVARGRRSGLRLGGIPATARRTTVHPARVRGAAGRASMRPLDAVALLERAPILLHRVAELPASLEDRAEIGVDERQVGGPDLHLLELLGRLVQHRQLEVD